MIVSPVFSGRRYAVLGLARSGLAAVGSLVASGADVSAWDARDEPRQSVFHTYGERVPLIDPCTQDLAGFAGVVVSPGIPINRHPIAEVAVAAGVPLFCDIELFAMARASLPPHRVVAITGTNGKSTTTKLVHHLLMCAGVPSLMGGNIGLPILAQQPLQPSARGDGVYVLELSSYQIDLTHTLDCDVAALLNITPDHLDRYSDFAAYATSKARLFWMQGAGQGGGQSGMGAGKAVLFQRRHAIFGLGDAQTAMIAAEVSRQRDNRWVNIVDGARLAEHQHQWPSLQGPHNLQNAAVAVAIVEALGLCEADWLPALGRFRGLPHRMERVAEANGVIFINDSKATNPASVAPALAAFPPASDGHKRIRWIVGGLPKGEDLDECSDFFDHVASAYTIGDAGPHFADILAPHMEVQRSEMLCEAVRHAIDDARPGDVVLLSPACASFDQFRDYEARGEAFGQMVDMLLAGRCEAGGGEAGWGEPKEGEPGGSNG